MGDYNLVTPPIFQSPDQIVQALLQAGFTPTQAAQMAAFSIGNEDPSGNASVVNDTPSTGDYSVGLYQINYYGSLRGPRTQEFGSPASLAGNPQAQANAAHALFEQSGYSPWQADIGKQNVANALPTAVQAVNDVQSGHITVADVASSTGSAGFAGPGSGASAGYSPAHSAFGKVLQEIDGFYNPTVTVVPSWTNIFGGGIINGVAGTILTGVDRAIGILFGVGLVYIGIRMMSEHGSSTGTLRTAVRVGGDVMVGREAAASRQAVQASRATVSARQIDQRAAQAAQRARESAARVTAQERATAVRAQAEARRSAEDENARRRRSDRPRERGAA